MIESDATNKIVKIIGDIYFVLSGEKIVEASCLKTIKKNRLFVGDNVELKENEYSANKYIITKVLPRKNIIPRPTIANIDKLLILVASVPKPDFLLIDKLIIYCYENSIEPVVVINKCDMSDKVFVEDVCNQYYFLQTFSISAKNKSGIDALSKYISNSICAVCGQSAVGKSTLINALIPFANLQTQNVSEKILRGKHTTRVNEIFVYNHLMIADTPGFSNLDLDVDFKELYKFYPEFEPHLCNCRYLDCSHIKEGNDCGVVNALKCGKVNKDRYLRYVELYKKQKEMWEKRYD